MALLLAAQKKPKSRSFGSVLKGVGGAGLGAVGWTFDKIMRPSWAVTAGVSSATRKGGFDPEAAVHGAIRGFRGKERKGFGQVLSEWDVLQGHKKIRGAVGFGLDVVTDPLMLASIAAAPVTGGGSIAAYTAAKAAGKSVGVEVVERAAREAGRKAIEGVTDDVIIDVLRAGGKGYEHRLAVAINNKELAGLGVPEGAIQSSLRSRKNILASMAKAEEKVNVPKQFRIGMGTRKHGIHLDTRIPTPKLNIPGLTGTKQALGKAFISGYDNNIFRAGEIARQHSAEFNALHQKDSLDRVFKGFSNKLSNEEMLEALHFMEQPLKSTRGNMWKAVLKDKNGDFGVNEKYLDKLVKEGHIDPIQRDFVRKYQNATEYLFHRDKVAGLSYKHVGEEGRMYVPHVVLKGTDDIPPTISQKTLMSEAGFEKKRGLPLSVLQIKKMVDEGKLPKDIETDPLKLIARRSRAGAERQADMALINTLKDSVGIPMRLVDEKKIAKGTARLTAATTKHEAALRQAANAEEALEHKVALAREEARALADDSVKALTKDIKDAKAKFKKKRLGPLETQIKKERAKLDKLQEQVGRYKPGPALNKAKKELDASETRLARLSKSQARIKFGSATNPAIQTMEARLAAVEGGLNDLLRDMGNPRTKAYKQFFGEEQLSMKTAKAALVDAKKEAKLAATGLRKLQKGKRNPAVSASQHVHIPKALDDWGNDYAFDPKVAASIQRVERLVSGEDKTVEDFKNGIGKWMAAWKVWVTSVNPGYRIRNTMTDFWNMWVAGVPVWAIGVYGKKSAGLMRSIKHGDGQATAFFQEATEHGILSGLFAGDIQAIARMIKYQGSKKALLKDKRFLKLYTKAMQDMNRNAENWGRLTHYMYRRQNLGESAADAAHMVKAAHFDYEDLTPFEQKVMKKIFPFYTWTRKNIPFQVKALLSRPGRYAAFPKLAQEAQYAAGDPDQPVPDFLAKSMGFPLPFGKDNYYIPQFGVSDLVPLEGPGQAVNRAFSMLTPAAKIPIEMYLNKSFFSRQPISSETHPRAPVTGLGAKLLSLVPGSNVGQTARIGPGGDWIQGPGANAYMAYLLGQTPMTRAAFLAGGGIRGKQTDHSALLSLLGGQSMVNVDPETQMMFDTLDLEDKVDKKLTGLRDEGKIKRKKKKKTDFDKLMEKVLAGGYG